MVLSSATLYRYELPLTAPLSLGVESWNCRRGLLLRLRTDQGSVGWGEAAPLPGFSPESLEDVIEHARAVVPEWIGEVLPPSNTTPEAMWEALPVGPSASASFRFATESAVVDLRAVAADTSPMEVLGSGGRSTVHLNALITDPLENGPSQARRHRERGCRAVKVKVGRAAMAQEIEALRDIQGVLGDDIALRADANRAWSLDEAVDFADGVSDLGLSYVEEPLTNPNRLSTLTTRTDLPVALDETTREVRPEALQDAFPAAAVVLKPTLLGLRETQAWSEAATAHDATPVLSAAYESGVAFRMLVALAAVGPDVPVGLSTYDRLAVDVLRPSLSLRGPAVDVSSVVNVPAAVDEDRLTRIETYSV